MTKNIWNLVKAYVKACGYSYTEKQVVDFYYNYYIRGAYCPHTFNDVMENYEKFNKNHNIDVS